MWLCIHMYDYVWLFMTVYNYLWLCKKKKDKVWLYMTPNYCMTMYDHVMRERERNRDQNLKAFSYFCKLFQAIKIFQPIQTFSHDSDILKLFIFFNQPNFVHLCLPLLPLFTFVQMTHLCTNFVLVSLINQQESS